jgi:hypothetical protein
MRPAGTSASRLHATSRRAGSVRPSSRVVVRVVALLQQQQRSATTSLAVGDSPSSNNQSQNNAVPFPRPASGATRRTMEQEQQQPSTRSAEPSGPLSRRSGADNAENFFAYASCLHRDTLYSRDVNGVLSRDPATLSEPGVRLAFRGVGGCATLICGPGPVSDMRAPPRRQPQPPGDGVVHGVLYRMEQAELLKLKRGRAGYQLTEMQVRRAVLPLRHKPPSLLLPSPTFDMNQCTHTSSPFSSLPHSQVKTYNGHEVRAWVFVASPMDTLPAEVAPPEAYMRQVREGAADQHLHHDYQAWLSSIETVPSAGLPGEYFDTPKNKVQHTLQYLLATVAIGALALVAAMKGLLPPM